MVLTSSIFCQRQTLCGAFRHRTTASTLLETKAFFLLLFSSFFFSLFLRLVSFRSIACESSCLLSELSRPESKSPRTGRPAGKVGSASPSFFFRRFATPRSVEEISPDRAPHLPFCAVVIGFFPRSLPPPPSALQARAHLMQAAAAKLDPIATEALAILEKKLMEDVSRDAAEVWYGAVFYETKE